MAPKVLWRTHGLIVAQRDLAASMLAAPYWIEHAHPSGLFCQFSSAELEDFRGLPWGQFEDFSPQAKGNRGG